MEAFFTGDEFVGLAETRHDAKELENRIPSTAAKATSLSP
jgi:hypothetical protein